MSFIHASAAGVFAWLIGLASAAAQAPASGRLLDVGGAFATRVENSDADIGTEMLRADAWVKVTVPVPLTGRHALLFGFSYEGHFMSYRGFASRDVGGIFVTRSALPTALHSLDASLGLAWWFAEPWSVSARLSPGIHSDFGSVRARDILWAGSVLFVRSIGREVPGGRTDRIGFGAAFTDRFGSPLPIPLVLVDWFPSEASFLRGTLPLDLDAGYRLSALLSVGLGALLKGSMYRLESAPFGGQVIRYREIQVGPFVDYGFTQRVRLRASGGVSAGHRFEFRDDRNDNVLLSGDYRPGAFFTAGVYYAP